MASEQAALEVDMAYGEWLKAMEVAFLAKEKYRWNQRARVDAELAEATAKGKYEAALKSFKGES